jgi:hypothetical protein
MRAAVFFGLWMAPPALLVPSYGMQVAETETAIITLSCDGTVASTDLGRAE